MEKNSEQLAKIKELLTQVEIDSFNQSLIKDNKIIFVLDEHVYRCKMPSQKELALAEDLENRLKVQMYQSQEYVSRSKLIKILKENQGIDIEAMEQKKIEYQDKLKNVYLDIAITHTDEKEKLDELKRAKEKIEEDFTVLIIEMTEALKPCIEERAKKKYYEFLASVCTEKSVGNEEWERVWKSAKEYEDDNSKLAHNGVGYLQTLLLNVRD